MSITVGYAGYSAKLYFKDTAISRVRHRERARGRVIEKGKLHTEFNGNLLFFRIISSSSTKRAKGNERARIGFVLQLEMG